MAFLAVIAVSVAATVWFTHRSGDQGGAGGGSSASTSEVASAGDTGPVGIITEDPTCDRFLSLQNEVGAQVTDWNKRDASVPASEWTPQQRQIYESAARIYKAEADQLVALAEKTPHRVMREIYSQMVAYNRAYAEAINNYTPSNDNLAFVRNGLGAAGVGICVAVRNFAATDRNQAVESVASPNAVPQLGNLSDPQRFVLTPLDACPKITGLLEESSAELQAWFKNADLNIPASQRGAAETILWDMAAKVLGRLAGDLEQAGRSSGNPVVEDFLVLSAQYYRAFVQSVPTYKSVDSQLYDVARQISSAVKNACLAAQE